MEARRVLANNILLDFTPDYIDNEYFVDDFADSFDADIVNTSNRFLNYDDSDNVIDLKDAQIAARKIGAKVRQLLKPFIDHSDIELTISHTTDLESTADPGVGETRLAEGQASDTQNNYVVYVGGNNPTTANEFVGFAHQAFDTENNEFYAFVFADDIRQYFADGDYRWKSRPNLTPIDFTNQVAYAIAHELGHLWGLGHIRDVDDPATYPDNYHHVMNAMNRANPGTARFRNEAIHEAEVGDPVTGQSNWEFQNAFVEVRDSLRTDSSGEFLQTTLPNAMRPTLPTYEQTFEGLEFGDPVPSPVADASSPAAIQGVLGDTTPGEIADAIASGYNTLRNSHLSDFANRMNLPGSLPLIGNDLDNIIGMSSALANAIGTINVGSASTMGDLQSSLENAGFAIESIIDDVTFATLPDDQPLDLVRASRTFSLAEMTRYTTLDSAALGALAELAGITYYGNMEVLVDAYFTIAFGVDTDGFYLLPGNGLEARIAAGGNINANIGSYGAIKGSADVAFGVNVPLRTSNADGRIRMDDLGSFSSASDLVVTGAASANVDATFDVGFGHEIDVAGRWVWDLDDAGNGFTLDDANSGFDDEGLFDEMAALAGTAMRRMASQSASLSSAAEKIPLIGESLATEIDSAIEDALEFSDALGSAREYLAARGIQVISELSVADFVSGDFLNSTVELFRMRYVDSIVTTVNVDAGEFGFENGVGGVNVDLTLGGSFDVTPTVDLDFEFGVDTSGGVFVVEDSSLSIDVDATATLNGSLEIGILKLINATASAAFDGGVTFNLNDDNGTPNEKFYFSDFEAASLTESENTKSLIPTGTVGLELELATAAPDLPIIGDYLSGAFSWEATASYDLDTGIGSYQVTPNTWTSVGDLKDSILDQFLTDLDQYNPIPPEVRDLLTTKFPIIGDQSLLGLLGMESIAILIDPKGFLNDPDPDVNEDDGEDFIRLNHAFDSVESTTNTLLNYLGGQTIDLVSLDIKKTFLNTERKLFQSPETLLFSYLGFVNATAQFDATATLEATSEITVGIDTEGFYVLDDGPEKKAFSITGGLAGAVTIEGDIGVVVDFARIIGTATLAATGSIDIVDANLDDDSNKVRARDFEISSLASIASSPAIAFDLEVGLDLDVKGWLGLSVVGQDLAQVETEEYNIAKIPLFRLSDHVGDAGAGAQQPEDHGAAQAKFDELKRDFKSLAARASVCTYAVAATGPYAVPACAVAFAPEIANKLGEIGTNAYNGAKEKEEHVHGFFANPGQTTLGELERFRGQLEKYGVPGPVIAIVDGISNFVSLFTGSWEKIGPKDRSPTFNTTLVDGVLTIAWDEGHQRSLIEGEDATPVSLTGAPLSIQYVNNQYVIDSADFLARQSVAEYVPSSDLDPNCTDGCPKDKKGYYRYDNKKTLSVADSATVTRIVVFGSDFDDEIVFDRNVPDPATVYAKSGDDLVVATLNDDWVSGGSGDDILYGSDGDDELHGDGDDDKLYGSEGDDEIFGGDGDDLLDESPIIHEYLDFFPPSRADEENLLNGGEGDDTLLGSPGRDIMGGERGADLLVGKEGDDILYGGPQTAAGYNANAEADDLLGGLGNDILLGGIGNDYLVGGLGDDSLRGEADSDTLKGDTDSTNPDDGHDTIHGGTGIDYIYGGGGNDHLFGDEDADYITAGKGNDLLVGASQNNFEAVGDGNDILDGGEDNDVLWGGPSGIGLPLFVSNPLEFDFLEGGDGEDTLNGGSGPDRMDGGDGFDELRGGDGNDTLLSKYANADLMLGQNGDDFLSNVAPGSTDQGIVGATLDGGEGDDTLVGSASANERIFGGPGHDEISGRIGHDTIVAGEGNDIIYGGPDSDFADDDSINAGAGDDTVFGGFGSDTIIGGDGNDTIDGEQGHDTINAGAGDDTVSGGFGSDTIIGSDGNDTIAGGQGDDDIDGGLHDDTIDGNEGHDTLVGGDGNDLIHGGPNVSSTDDDEIDAGVGNDTVYGGAGRDIITGQIGNDTIYGGPGDDHIDGGEGDNRLSGDEGHDQIVAGSGHDLIHGGPDFSSTDDDTIGAGGGDDTIHGGDGEDQIDAGDGSNVVFGGPRNDEIHAYAGNDLVFGGEGDDQIFVRSGADTVHAGDGVDTVLGGDGDDVIRGDAGNDILEGGLGDDDIDGGDDNDLIYADQGNDIVQGGLGDDQMIGSLGDDSLSGGGGNDWIEGGLGLDTINGGDADDRLFGGADRDVIEGGFGNDVIDAGTGTGDSLVGGSGNDQIHGSVQGASFDPDFGDTTYFGDVIVAGPGNDQIWAHGGADFIDAGAGDDRVYGGLGGDLVHGGSGNDWIYVGESLGDVVNGDDGDDVIVGSHVGNDSLHGGLGNDSLYGQGGDDDLQAGEGDDFVDAGTGTDTVSGGPGDDELLGGGGIGDELSGDEGDDILRGSNDGADLLMGGVGRDWVIGNGSNDVLFGDEDDDILKGGDGDDTIEGGSGADVLVGQGHHDVLHGHSAGGAGDDNSVDYLYGDFGTGGNEPNSGQDRLFGGGGNDVLFAEAGDDFIDAGGGSSNLVDYGTGEGAVPSDFVPPSPTADPLTQTGAQTVAPPVELPLGVDFAGPWGERSASVSGAGLSGLAGVSSEPSIAVHGANRYVTWADNRSGRSQILVARHDDTDGWQLMGDGTGIVGVSDSAFDAEQPSIAIDSNGNPIVAWKQSSSSGADIYLRVWDPTANANLGEWVELAGSASGGGISGTSTADRPSIANTDLGPVVMWLDSQSGASNVMLRRFDTVGDAWEEIAGSATGAGVSNATTDVESAAIATDGVRIAVSWEQTVAAQSQIFVNEFAGTAFNELSGSASGTGVSGATVASTSPSIQYHQGNLFLTWQDRMSQDDVGQGIYAVFHDGTSWQEAGAGAASGRGVAAQSEFASQPTLAGDGNDLYLTWSESTDAIYIRKWNGTSFDEHSPGDASGIGIAARAKSPTHLTTSVDSDGRPWVVWQDNSLDGPQIALVADAEPTARTFIADANNSVANILAAEDLEPGDRIFITENQSAGFTVSADDSGVTIVGLADVQIDGTVTIDSASDVTLMRLNARRVNSNAADSLTVRESTIALGMQVGGNGVVVVHNAIGGTVSIATGSDALLLAFNHVDGGLQFDGTLSGVLVQENRFSSGVSLEAAVDGRITDNVIAGLTIIAPFTGSIDHNDITGSEVGVRYHATASLSENRIHGNTTGVEVSLGGPAGFGFVDVGQPNEIFGNDIGVSLVGGTVQNQLIRTNRIGIDGIGDAVASDASVGNRVERNDIGISIDGKVAFNRISGNRIGIAASDRQSITHNTLLGNTETGIDSEGVSGVRIVGNTIDSTTGDNVRIRSGSSDIEVRNNSLWTRGGFNIDVAGDSEAGFFSDYNTLHATDSGTILRYSGVEFADILDWQVELGQYDLHSRGTTVVNPSWSRPRYQNTVADDYRFRELVAGLRFTSPMIDAGDPLVDVGDQRGFTNLLGNPSFENGLTGWVTNGEASAGSAEVEAFDQTKYFDAGNVAVGQSLQTVDLVASGYTDVELDSGDLVAIYGGRTRTAPGADDESSIKITFLDASNGALGTSSILSSNPTERWELTGRRVAVPVGTRSIIYEFNANQVSGLDNDAFLDAAFLSLRPEWYGPDVGASGSTMDDDPTAAAPHIAIRSPDLYIDWEAAKPRNILWETFNNENESLVRLDLYQDSVDGPAFLSTIAAATTDDGVFEWRPSDNGIVPGTHGLSIQVSLVDQPIVLDRSTEVFSVPEDTVDFFVNDGDLTSDQYTTAIGDNRNTGRLASSPKPTPFSILNTYTLGPTNTLFVDAGQYDIVRTLVLSGSGKRGDDEGFVFTGPTNMDATAVLVYQNPFSPAPLIELDDADFVTLSNLILNDAKHGVWLRNESTGFAGNNLTLNNHSNAGILVGFDSAATSLEAVVASHNGNGGIKVEGSVGDITHSIVEFNAGNGIEIWNADNSQIQANVVRSNRGNGLIVYGTSGALTIGNQDLTLGQGNLVAENGNSGIVIQTSGATIAGNTIFGHGSNNGIYSSLDALVRSNIAYGNSVGIHSEGTISGNRVYGNDIGIIAGGRASRNVVYSNDVGITNEQSIHSRPTLDLDGNLVYANSEVSIDLSAGQLSGNTIYQSGGLGIAVNGGVTLHDNIIWADGGAAVRVADDSTSGFFSDDNLLYATGGGAVGIWQGATAANLAQWRTVSLSDLNSLSQDPLFVDANGSDDVLGFVPGLTDGRDDDFHLQSPQGSFHGGSFAPVIDSVTGLPIMLTATETADLQSSPAIDRGATSSDFSAEPSANGAYRNLGAYGNTEQASKSPTQYVLLTSPDGGETWPESQTFDIKWRSESNTGTVDIELIQDDGSGGFALIDTIATAAANSGTQSWTVPVGITAGEYQIRVTQNASGAADISNAPFFIREPVSAYYVNIAGDVDLSDNEFTTAAGDDSNDGLTPATPKASLQALLAAYDLEPGDRILVDVGTYHSVTNIVIAEEDSGITISGPEVGVAIIDRGDTGSGNYAFEFRGPSGVTLERLSVTGADVAFYAGVRAGGAGDASSEGLLITNNRVYSNRTGVSIGEMNPDAVVQNNVIHDNVNGIELAPAINTLVQFNEIYENTGWGIQSNQFLANGSVHQTIRQNTIYRNEGGIVAASYGNATLRLSENVVHSHWGRDVGLFLLEGAISENNIVHSNLVGLELHGDAIAKGNRVYNNATGILLSGSASFTSIAHVIENRIFSNQTGIYLDYVGGYIANNVIYDQSDYGIRAERGFSPRVESNTFFQAKGNAILGYQSTFGLTVKNNIFRVDDGFVFDVTADSQSDFFSDSNLLQFSSSIQGRGLARWGSQDFDNLADWSDLVGFDQDSLQADPLFIDFDGADDVLGYAESVLAEPTVVDDSDPSQFAVSGNWTPYNGGFNGTFRSNYTNSTTDESATWVIPDLEPGSDYQLAATWPQDNGSLVAYSIVVDGVEVATYEKDQSQLPDDYFADVAVWETLGVFTAGADVSVVLKSASATSRTVYADAIRVIPIGGESSDGSDDNFHLQSISPAVDRGEPNGVFINEPSPNGGRLNLGAFGNTSEATTSNAKTLQVLNPNRLQKMQVGDVLPIRVRSDGLTDKQFVTLLNSGGDAIDNWREGSYRTGTEYSNSLFGAVDLSGIADPAPSEVYARYDETFSGPLTYQIPVPDGQYEIRLHFAEPFAGAGNRIFDISLQGNVVESAFDISALAGGSAKAYARTLSVAAIDGQGVALALIQNGGSYNPILSGIELTRANLGGSSDPTVDLEYSVNNGTTWQSIHSGLALDRFGKGQFDWTVPADAETYGHTALIRVSEASGTSDVSDQPFLVGAAGSNYYVNIAEDADLTDNQYTSSPGRNELSGTSPDQPMSSLRALLSAYDLGEGDTVFVDIGHYLLPANIIIDADDAGVTIQGPTTGHAVLDRGNLGSAASVFELRDQATLANLSLIGAGRGISIANNNASIVIQDSAIYENTIGIYGAYQNGNVSIQDNRIHGNRYGVYWADGAGLEVIDNQIFGQATTGIWLYSTSATIAGNELFGESDAILISQDQGDTTEVFDNHFHGNDRGIVMGRSPGNVHHNRFVNNDIGIDQARGQMEANTFVSNRIGVQIASSSVLANNLFNRNSEQGIRIDSNETLSETVATNNSFYQESGDAISVANYGQLKLANNLFQVAIGYALNVSDRAQYGFESDYNIFQVPQGTADGGIAFWNGKDYDDLYDWRGDNAFDIHSLSADPQFIDPIGGDGIGGFSAVPIGASIVIDDGDDAFQSDLTSSLTGGFQDDYLAGDATDGGTATWTFTDLVPGAAYQLAATWPTANLPGNANYRISDDAGVLAEVNVAQRFSPDDFTADGADWEELGFVVSRGTGFTVTLLPGVSTIYGSTRYHADAIRIQQVHGDNSADDNFRLLSGSPAIDSADPNLPFDHENAPNGGRRNIGAFGNTPDAANSAAKVIQVVSPNGRERIEADDVYHIEFIAVGLSGEQVADVELSLDGGATWTPIGADVPFDSSGRGIFDWTVPDSTITVGHEALIRISHPDVSDVSDETFTITNSGHFFFVNTFGDDDFTDNEYTTAAGAHENSGKSPDRPMASLKGLLEAYDLEPGDVIYVDTGIYAVHSNIDIRPEDSGVVIQGPLAAGNFAVLDRSNTERNHSVINVEGADDITIAHLSLTGAHTGLNAGPFQLDDEVYLIENLLVTANQIYSNAEHGIWISIQGEVVDNEVFGNGNGIRGGIVKDNRVYENSEIGIDESTWVEGNEVYGNDIGIEVKNDGTAIGNDVHHNRIGIQADDGNVTSNAIENRVYANTVGIEGHNLTVQRNQIYSNETGINNASRVVSNTIYANTNTGVRLSSWRGSQLLNNSIYQIVGDAVLIDSFYETLIANNILSIESGYAINVVSGTNIESVNNVFQLSTDPNANVGFWNSANLATLADWQATTNLDESSIEGDPLWVDINGVDNVLGFVENDINDPNDNVNGGADDNFQLSAGSPAIDRGHVGYSPSTDLIGAPHHDDPGSPNLSGDVFVELPAPDRIFGNPKSVGVAQSWNADDGAWNLDLPFTFEFYGNSYSAVTVSSNGFLHFAGPDDATSGLNSTATLENNVRIAPLWDDLSTAGSGDDIFVDASQSDRVAIRWDATNVADGSDSQFSVVLFSDGTVQFDYGSGNTNLSPTVGISGNAESVLAAYDGASTLSHANSLTFALGNGYQQTTMPSQFSATGVAQGLRADEEVWPVALPQTLEFFGVAYNSFEIHSNGFIHLAGPDSDSDYTNSAEELLGNVRIAPMWDDLYSLNPADDIYVDASVPGQWTIRWQYSTYDNDIPVNFAVVFFGDGQIRFDYGGGNTPITATIGISDGNGFGVVQDNVTTLENADSILFTPVSGYIVNDTGANDFFQNTAGTPRNWQSDRTTWTLNLPFAFPFFDTTYTSVEVSTEGFLQFDTDSSRFDESNSQDELRQNRRIAPLWDNLYTWQVGDDIFVDTSVPEQVTVRWDATNWEDDSDVNVAVRLYSDGSILFDYGQGNTNLTPTVGIGGGPGYPTTLAPFDGLANLTNAGPIYFATQPGFSDIGAYEFQGSSNDVTPPSVVSTAPNAIEESGATNSNLDSIVIAFSEKLDVLNANLESSYDLRVPGGDGLFDTADDQVFGIAPTYHAGSFTVALEIADAALIPEGIDIRLTILGDAIRDVSGLGLDGDGDGSWPNDYVRIFQRDTVAPIVSINPVSTTDTTPSLTGTIDDNSAVISVLIDGNSYSATNGGDGTWALDGATIDPTLSDGTYNVIVTATDPAGNVGIDDSQDEVVVDATAPVVAIVPVDPDPRTTNVNALTITFDEPVVGVSIDDFVLTRGGVTVDLSTAVLTGSGTTYQIDLSSGTNASGSYLLTLAAVGSGIEDSFGNALGADATDDWLIDLIAPVGNLVGITPDFRSGPVPTISIVFSEAVFGLTLSDFSLTRDGEPSLLPSSVLLTTTDNVTWTISDLSSETSPDGAYIMTLRADDHIVDSVGNVLDEDSVISWVVEQLDFGDAPATYGTRFADDGARHSAVGPRLGDTRSAESDANPGASADGDGEEEDGVMFGVIDIDQALAGVNIDLQNASEARVDAWLDFNGNGIWENDEHILDNRQVFSGLQTLNFSVPNDATDIVTYARVRISSSGFLTPTGYSPDGEVEDYQVQLYAVGSTPTIESVVVGDGDDQRSIVSKLEVRFDQEVDLNADAFELKHRGTGEIVDTIQVASTVVDGKTVSTLTFLPGDHVVDRNGVHSLVDGNYELLIQGASVSATASGLNVEEDFVFGDQASDNFFRYYGDSDGDRDVDGMDFGRFGLAFLKISGQPGYDPNFDFDGDGDVDGEDYGRFSQYFLKRLKF